MKVLSDRKKALEQFREQIRVELEQARLREDPAGIARLRAMQSVLETWALPRACPFTVTLAGHAAVASLRGQSEEECCAGVFQRYGHFPEGRLEVSTAVQLLKATGLWPWAAPGRAGHTMARRPSENAHDMEDGLRSRLP